MFLIGGHLTIYPLFCQLTQNRQLPFRTCHWQALCCKLSKVNTATRLQTFIKLFAKCSKLLTRWDDECIAVVRFDQVRYVWSDKVFCLILIKWDVATNFSLKQLHFEWYHIQTAQIQFPQQDTESHMKTKLLCFFNSRKKSQKYLQYKTLDFWYRNHQELGNKNALWKNVQRSKKNMFYFPKMP